MNKSQISSKQFAKAAKRAQHRNDLVQEAMTHHLVDSIMNCKKSPIPEQAKAYGTAIHKKIEDRVMIDGVECVMTKLKRGSYARLR